MNILLLNLFARAAHERLVDAVLGTPTWFRPVLVVPCRAGQRTWYLVAVLEAPGPFIHLTAERPLEGAQAPERFEVLSGRRVTAISSPSRDRLLRLEVDAPSSGVSAPMSLLFHLYGSQATVQLRREEATLESVGGKRRHDHGSGRQPSLVDISGDELNAAIEAADKDAPVRTAVAGLEDSLVTAFPGPSGVDAAALVKFRDELVGGGTPFSLAYTKRAANGAPVPSGLSADDMSVAGPFTSAEAATSAVGEGILAEAKRRMVTSQARPFNRHLAGQKKLLVNLRGDLERSRGHERLRHEAEILAAYQSSIRPGAAEVELADIYDPDTTVSITLDPALHIRAQIEKRFKKATKLEKSETHTRRRIELVENEIRELEAALTVLERSESFARALFHLEAFRTRFDIDTAPDTPAAKRPGGRPPALPYRRFELDGGWFALVGKSSKDNDELTFRHAAPTDIWLHAQSIPGSHVVLKSPGAPTPPTQVLEAAAAIAAHFSRAKHSGLVPVIYTERRYVRKFRGAKPGQVRCEREKMVMVEPGLPDAPPPQ